ncbi:hypothetical protein KFK09_011647 [Dendrobium nobile]|uniref:HAT C-terminal dimerisation domain-containing protein n=1 Tax=Dendrobium nobile TaxID=94219 RepID=A0A8T3BD62_DENNO|nr:hypothetical protein KFK09_011647 [Dendrobium nobile]
MAAAARSWYSASMTSYFLLKAFLILKACKSMEDSNTLPKHFIDENEEVDIKDNVVEPSNDGSVVLKKRGRMTSKMVNKDVNVKNVVHNTCVRVKMGLDFDSFEEEVYMPKKSELEIYLDEPKLDRKIELDILNLWKGNQYRFPEVYAMARDVLCIPITTVASESAFSNSGRILDQYRSSLKPDIVEALVCAKDWLYGDKVLHNPELEAMTEDILALTVTRVEDEPGESSVINIAANSLSCFAEFGSIFLLFAELLFYISKMIVYFYTCLIDFMLDCWIAGLLVRWRVVAGLLEQWSLEAGLLETWSSGGWTAGMLEQWSLEARQPGLLE